MYYDTNVSSNVQITPINELYSVDTNKIIKENLGVYYDAPQSSYSKQKYIHDDVELERRLPYYETRTNNGMNIHKKIDGKIHEKVLNLNRPATEVTTSYRGSKTVDNMNRQYNLRPTISAGGFEAVPSVPSVDRQNILQDFDTDKSRMRQRIYDMQQDRNVSLGNIPYAVQSNPE